jgi:hypothetical protein
MAQIIYGTSTGAAPFTSTTAIQTVIAVVNAATDCGIQLKKYKISFNGAIATNPPVTVRLFSTNNATAGTSTAGTITRHSGLSVVTTNLSAAFQYTVEPTTKTYIDEFLLTPNGGTVIYDYPLGDEPEVGISSTLGLEITASVAVGVAASLLFTRI